MNNKGLIKSVTISIPDMCIETRYDYCDACKCSHEFVFGDKDIKSQSECLLLWYKLAEHKVPDNCILNIK